MAYSSRFWIIGQEIIKGPHASEALLGTSVEFDQAQFDEAFTTFADAKAVRFLHRLANE